MKRVLSTRGPDITSNYPNTVLSDAGSGYPIHCFADLAVQNGLLTRKFSPAMVLYVDKSVDRWARALHRPQAPAAWW